MVSLMIGSGRAPCSAVASYAYSLWMKSGEEVEVDVRVRAERMGHAIHEVPGYKERKKISDVRVARSDPCSEPRAAGARLRLVATC